MKYEDPIYISGHKISCEGIASGAGHPKIYLEMKDDEAQCPYCSQIFKYKKMKNENN